MNILNDCLFTARMWAAREVSLASPLFITGCPRSGTTLLKSLLVAHTEICGTLYESTGLFRIRNLKEFHVSGVPSEEMRANLRDATSAVDLFARVEGYIKSQSNATWFVDKLWPSKTRFNYVRGHLPRARFLQIVRDGRDCYCSAVHHPNIPQAKSLLKFAKYWRTCVRTVEKMVPESRLYTVRYEDLTSEPVATLQKVMGWIGLPYQSEQTDPRVFKPSIAKSFVHKNLNQPVSPNSCGRWRDELSDKDKNAFLHIAKAELEKFSYAIT